MKKEKLIWRGKKKNEHAKKKGNQKPKRYR
jgi:hypothetical protein